MSSSRGRSGMRVAVAMSGGVDSTLAAWLLKLAGHEVVGVFINCWEDDGLCPAGEDAAAAAAAADSIGIELESLDLTGVYRRRVFASFLAELQAGRTPSPDINCNEEVKFGAFADNVFGRLGAQRMATGHYARTGRPGPRLLKAEDGGKDQTYFLHRLSGAQLERVVFPLGGMLKTEVRSKALAAGLPNARRAESMGICFIGRRPFRKFIAGHIPPRAGAFVASGGRTVGEHAGAHLYTVGQRSGLGLGGSGEPWYVTGKDIAANTVTVVRGRDHALLFSSRVTVSGCSWVAGRAPKTNWVYTCRYRHRMEPTPCTLEAVAADGSAVIAFAQPQWAVAPGQAAVLYDGNICLGGGPVATTEAEG